MFGCRGGRFLVLFAPSSSSQQPCSRQPGAWQPPRGLPSAAVQGSLWAAACLLGAGACCSPPGACLCRPLALPKGRSPRRPSSSRGFSGRRVWERTLLVAVPSSIWKPTSKAAPKCRQRLKEQVAKGALSGGGDQASDRQEGTPPAEQHTGAAELACCRGPNRKGSWSANTLACNSYW